MKKVSNVVFSLVAIAFVLALAGCGPTVSKEYKSQEYYTKYNFHYTTEKGIAMGSVANYTKMKGHEVLPYNSKVKVSSGNKGYTITDAKTGTKINVLVKSFLDGMSLSEYFDKTLSPTPVSYSGLSSIDKQGIQYGRPEVGMSKKAVMIALGYPCPHKTPSPDLDIWYYWTNRMVKYEVVFENGKVISHGY